MSTNGIIAWGKSGTDWEGRYHHWDSYPNALGKTLYDLYNGYFKKNSRAMKKVLFTNHPAGWSSINDCDFNLEPGFENLQDLICKVCGEPEWKHYAQYYPDHGLPEPVHVKNSFTVSVNNLPIHAPQPQRSNQPECYCHGSRSEEGQLWTPQWILSSAIEWVYVIDEDTSVMRVYSVSSPRYLEFHGRVLLNDTEPNWDRLDRIVLIESI